jgi:hypothetical protein
VARSHAALQRRRPGIPLLILLPVLSFVFGCLEYGPARGPEAGSAPLTIHAVLALAVVFAWFVIDTRDRGYRASIVLRVAMLALPIVALPYYLFRSRGATGGIKAMASVVLVFAGTMAAYRLGSWFA